MNKVVEVWWDECCDTVHIAFENEGSGRPDSIRLTIDECDQVTTLAKEIRGDTMKQLRRAVSGGNLTPSHERPPDAHGEKMTSDRMFRAALNRPRNFQALSHRDQWAIDKRLGILDWEGPQSDDERRQYTKRKGGDHG